MLLKFANHASLQLLAESSVVDAFELNYPQEKLDVRWLKLMADMALPVMAGFRRHREADHPADHLLLEVVILTIGMMNHFTGAVERPLQDVLLARGKYIIQPPAPEYLQPVIILSGKTLSNELAKLLIAFVSWLSLIQPSCHLLIPSATFTPVISSALLLACS